MQSVAYNNYTFLYIFFWILGISMIVYSIYLHFSIYDAQYIPIKAEIVNVYCNRYIINRQRDDYHCVLTLKYEINNKMVTSSIQTVNTINQYVGAEVIIYVDKENPINIYTPNISQEYLSTIILFIGILIIIVTTGIKLIDI